MHSIVDETWIVSTVGMYLPLSGNGDFEGLGYPAEESYFETMVFRSEGPLEVDGIGSGCGCHQHGGRDVECDRYATAGAARAGHAAMVEKWLGRTA